MPSNSPPPKPNYGAQSAFTTGMKSEPEIQRKLSRRATESELRAASQSPSVVRRRSSLVSDLSFDGARRQFQSSTDSLLLPRPEGHEHQHDPEPSHWHSAPLAFAIIPAIAGLFFQNGSSFATDALLLGLAAIFLNWSVRLPWEWYHKAQAIKAPEADYTTSMPEDTIYEESSEDERIGGTAKSGSSDPPKSAAEALRRDAAQQKEEERSAKRNAANRELRRHEMFALFFCFLGPAAGAFLLHTLRAQLSRPSEGLVSNYNLTIFLLAAELRPFAHIIKLMQSRTLHLQRIAKPPELSEEKRSERAHAQDLERRLGELETHIADAASGKSKQGLGGPDASEITSTVNKALQPQIDALTRAIRRYEKRATTQAIQTEARMQNLERRVQDALSLAAVAAKSSQQPGTVFAILDLTMKAFMLPLSAAWTAMVYPFQFIESTTRRLKLFLIGPRARPKKRPSERKDRAEKAATKGTKG